MAPRDPPTVPPEATRALAILAQWLGPAIAGVYLHGSAVGEGLREWSDVDVLAVVGAPLPPGVRAPLTADLMSVSGLYPVDPKGRRPLEVVIVRSDALAGMPYPARAEFVYGEWLRAGFEAGAVPQPEAGPEFTLLLAQARREAVPLAGPGIAELIPGVPPELVRRASGDLLPEIVASVAGDERNVLLTLARMWRTLATGEFVSKASAADWAAPQLSARAATTLAGARDAHLGAGADDLHRRGIEVWQAVEEMRERILAILRPLP